MDMQNFDNSRRGDSGGCRGYVHVVESGDTLYRIARKYDVKLFDIMRLNPYVNVYNLQIGDEVCIPTMSSRPEKTYVVNEGDTISDILKAFGLGFEALAKWNPTLMDVELPEGLILKVPLIQPRNTQIPDFENDYQDNYEDSFDHEMDEDTREIK